MAEIARDFGRAALYRGDYAYYPLESSFNEETGEWEYTDREEREGRGQVEAAAAEKDHREHGPPDLGREAVHGLGIGVVVEDRAVLVPA